jgi:hypothetical protein
MAALLPFAVAWHVTYLTATAACLIGAAILAAGCHITHEHRVATFAIIPELTQLPEFAASHKRLRSTRNRQALAAGLRRTAAPTQPPRRFDTCSSSPTHSSQTDNPNPASVALVHELLTNACSPLYNPNLPAEDLHATISRAHAGIRLRATTQPPAPPLHEPDRAAQG